MAYYKKKKTNKQRAFLKRDWWEILKRCWETFYIGISSTERWTAWAISYVPDAKNPSCHFVKSKTLLSFVSLHTFDKQVTPFSLYPPTGYCCLQLGSSMSLLFLRLKKPNLPSLSSYTMRSLTILVASTGLAPLCHTLFSWGAQNWAKAGSLDTALQTLSHKYHKELKDHFPRPAGYTLTNTAQDAVCLFCYKSTLLTHVQLRIIESYNH